MLMTFLKILLYIPVWLMLPTIFKGKRNIPKGKVIFVCNHRSNFDAVLLALSTFRNQKYLAKKELFKNKFVGGFLKALGSIPIDRNGTDIKAVKLCLTALKKGKILTIFPEGTRNKTEQVLGEVKSGACLMAIKSKTPIVPVWISKKPKLFCINTLTFGKAFTLDEFYNQKLDKETLEQAGNILQEKILENKK